MSPKYVADRTYSTTSFNSSVASSTSTPPVSSPTLAAGTTITQDINTIHQRRLVTITEEITLSPENITSWLVVILYITPGYNHIAGLQTWEPMVGGLVLKWITLPDVMQ